MYRSEVTITTKIPLPSELLKTKYDWTRLAFAKTKSGELCRISDSEAKFFSIDGLIIKWHCLRNGQCTDAVTFELSIRDYKKLLSAADQLAKVKVAGKCKKNELTYYNDYICKSKEEALSFILEIEKVLKE